MDARVRCPCEDKQTDGDEPAREHHGDQALLGRRFAVVLGRDGQVVFVDEGGAGGAHEDAEGERNEHEAGGSGAPSLARLIDDRIALLC